MELNERSALVAGGASGLGAATARELHSHGAFVTIADRDQERGQALADELGDRASFAAMDVTDATQVEAAVAQAAAIEGGLTTPVLTPLCMPDQLPGLLADMLPR